MCTYYVDEIDGRFDFTNILQGNFVPISVHQKGTSTNCKYRKAAHNTFVQKRYLKDIDKNFTKKQKHKNLVNKKGAILFHPKLLIILLNSLECNYYIIELWSKNV